jgi:hypothetical protein
MAIVPAILGLSSDAGRTDTLEALADELACRVPKGAAVEISLAFGVLLAQARGEALVVNWAILIDLAAHLGGVETEPVQTEEPHGARDEGRAGRSDATLRFGRLLGAAAKGREDEEEGKDAAQALETESHGAGVYAYARAPVKEAQAPNSAAQNQPVVTLESEGSAPLCARGRPP